MNAVSVVMATNKTDAFFEQAVASVFANSDVEIELVIVLDGISIPNSQPEWSIDSRVTLVTLSESSGLPAALNAGIHAAKYDIIARLDADDNALPTRFSKQVEVLFSASNPVLVGSRTVLIDEYDRVLGDPKQTCGKDIRRELLLQNVVPHSTYLFRKSDAIAIGLYNIHLPQMEDYDFLLRIAKRGEIAVVCDRLVQYRVHSGQMSRKASWRANYITQILRGRRELGALLKVSSIEIGYKNVLWRMVQLARSTGVLKPRYLMGIKKPAKDQTDLSVRM